MKLPREIVSPVIAIVASGALFLYLSETSFHWRIIFSVLLFLATYIMIDGFLRSA